VTVIWMGCNIAHFETRYEAGSVLKSFVRAAGPENFGRILVAVDGCQDAQHICAAHDVPGGHSQRWIKCALEEARRRLCRNDVDPARVGRFFDQRYWKHEGIWDARKKCYASYVAPVGSLTSLIHGQMIILRPGERVRVLSSAKWDTDDVRVIAADGRCEVKSVWKNSAEDYGQLALDH